MALLSCIQNPITLEIYLDEAGAAKGSLYLDNGESLDYLSDSSASALIDFSFENKVLTSSFGSGNYYALPSS
jgi:hypothetical protein